MLQMLNILVLNLNLTGEEMEKTPIMNNLENLDSTDVMTCEKDDQRWARNREYQRKHRAKADGNQKEQPDPHATKQQGLIINNVTTLLLHVIDVERTGLQVMTQKKHIMSTWRILTQ